MPLGPFVPKSWNAPLAVPDWPQDTLQVPYGFGQMPVVAPRNANHTQRDAFVYSGQLLNVGVPEVAEIIPIDADGDFWCRNIRIGVFGGATFETPVSIGMKLQIEDIRTGLKMFRPYGRTSLFMSYSTFSVTNNETDISLIGDLPQLFPFTRNGGIRITVQNDTNYPVIYVAAQPLVNVFISFTGWKEYENASH